MVKAVRVETATKVVPSPETTPSNVHVQQEASPTKRLPATSLNRTWRRQRTSAVIAASHEVPLENSSPSKLNVTLDTSSHKLSWVEAVHELDRSGLAKEEVLPAGTCVLYTFPRIKTADDVVLPSAAGISILRQIVLWLATSAEAFGYVDAVGAYPIHALMVCNSNDAVSLSMEIYERVPQMVKLVHAAPKPPCLYDGESSLHILAVNRREAQFIRLVEIAVEHLPVVEVEKLLRAQPSGFFFHKKPMRQYGGTALSYACCFGMKDAIRALLKTQLVDLNKHDDCCKLSGFLPLHAVVANRQVSMYDFLTCDLPAEWRADVKHMSQIGRLPHNRLCVTPLQLATLLGDHSTVRHILRKQCDIMWVWGPVTQFSLDLEGIDSSGKGGNDIMELIVRTDAIKTTTEMLLDSFMNGFINELYIHKWFKYGRKIHYSRLLLEGCLLVSLAVQAMYLKADPTWLTEGGQSVTILHLVIMALIVTVEVYINFKYAAKQWVDASQHSQPNCRSILKMVRLFLVQHDVHIQFLAFAFLLTASVLILYGDLPDPRLMNQTTDAYSAGRQLRGGGGSTTYTLKYTEWPVVDEGGWAWLFMTQAIALLLQCVYFAFRLFVPFERPNVMLCTVMKMLSQDLVPYMQVFLFVFASCYLSLFVLYPRSGENNLPQVEVFNHWETALFALVDLSFIGEQVALGTVRESFDAMSSAQIACMFVFIGFYYMYMLFSLIMMMNLVIAMMSSTYSDVFGQATLQSRLRFATYIMKLEIIAEICCMPTRVGEPTTDGKCVYTFRAMEGMDETESTDDYLGDNTDDSGKDPFAPPAPTQLSRMFSYLQDMKRDLVGTPPTARPHEVGAPFRPRDGDARNLAKCGGLVMATKRAGLKLMSMRPSMAASESSVSPEQLPLQE